MSIETFKLKMSLLKIWAVKNSGLFVKIILIIGAGIMFFYIPFDNVSIANIIKNSTNVNDMVIDILAAIMSAVAFTTTFVFKSAKIELDDIKTSDLKRSLIKAGYCFKGNKLIKNAESLMKIDLNTDGKIGDVQVVNNPSDGVLKQTASAVDELSTIVTREVKNQADHDVVVKDIKAEKAMSLFSKTKVVETVEDVTETILEKASDAIESKLDEIDPNDGSTKDTIVDGIRDGAKTVISKISSGVKTILSKISSSSVSEEDLEMIDGCGTEDTAEDAASTEVVSEAVEEVVVKKTTKPVSVKTTATTKTTKKNRQRPNI